MKVLVTGGAKNGKSSLAQKICSAVSAKEKRFYAATMIPRDDEDLLRVKKHVEQRFGLYFKTVECPYGLCDNFMNIELDGESAVLVDSITAVLANLMFRDGTVDFNAGNSLCEDFISFCAKCTNVVLVSDGIFCDSGQYDEYTEAYRKFLAECERKISGECECTIEMCCGKPVFNWNETCSESTRKKLMEICIENEKKSEMNSAAKKNLIVGGAFQGKTEYAKKQFSLVDGDICSCSKTQEPDFTKKCLSHLENYVWYCLKNGMELKTDFDFANVLIADDVSCGVVPVDAFERKWREECGLYLQKIAGEAAVTRIICGYAQKLN